MAVGQFYRIALDNGDPYRIAGGLQDNGSWMGPSGTLFTTDDSSKDGILNSDWQVVGGSDGFTVAFDPIVTAQQVRSYKPAHGHFLTAGQRLGGVRWLHAAQSYFHDVTPARELGIPVAWINRRRQTPSGTARPDRELTTLAELADWLA